MAKMSKREEAARICGWVPLKCDGFECVHHPEHGFLAPDFAAASDPDFRTGPWLASLRVSHRALFA